MSVRTSRVLATAAAVVIAGMATGQADNQELVDRIKQLEQKVAQLEGASTKEVTSASIPAETLSFLEQTKISGYVAGSFFHTFNNGQIGGGSQLAGHDDEFMINQFKLALDKPVDASPDKWDAGYSAHLIFGQDAGYFGFAGLSLGGAGFVEKATVTANVPVGNGLLVEVGRMVTLMGVEVVEPTINPNWSLGNQFVFVEPTTHLGAHLTYKFTDKVTGELSVFNGWDVVGNDNNSLSFMGRLTLTLSDSTTLALLGYGGPEGAGNNSQLRSGAEAVLTQKLGDRVTAYIQADYGHEDFNRFGDPNAEWYAGGVWVVYQASEKVAFALRGDYLRDGDSSRVGGGFPTPGNTTELTSLTGTVNWSPVANLQIRPELRWDRSTEGTFGTGAKQDQVIAGLGVAYLY